MSYTLPTPSEWLSQLSLPTDNANPYYYTERVVRGFLADEFPNAFALSALVEILWPAKFAAKGSEPWDARERLFPILKRLARTAMADCVSKGEPYTVTGGRLKGKTARHTIFHSPEAKPAPLVCKHCGQALPSGASSGGVAEPR